MAWRFARSEFVSTTRIHSEHTRQRRAFIGDIGAVTGRLIGLHLAVQLRAAIGRGAAKNDLIGTFIGKGREIVKGTGSVDERQTFRVIVNVHRLDASVVVIVIAVKSLLILVCFLWGGEEGVCCAIDRKSGAINRVEKVMMNCEKKHANTHFFLI